MNGYEGPFDKAADDAMFAEYMTPDFFDLPSEEIYLRDSGIASMALRLYESSTATIQGQSIEPSAEPGQDAAEIDVGKRTCHGLLPMRGEAYAPLADMHQQEKVHCASGEPYASACQAISHLQPPLLHLPVSAVRTEHETVSAPLSTASRKRPTPDADRADKRPAPKRIRTSKDGSSSRHPRRTANPVGQPQASPDCEGNALIHNKLTSSTSNCEDNVLADGKVPDTVTVLGQGPPPSRPAKKTRKGNKNQTPYLTTDFNCHICKTGSARLPDLERHNRTAEHAKQARQRGINVVIEVEDSLRCPAPRCKIVKPYSRRDALIRHMHEKHPGVPIPRT